MREYENLVKSILTEFESVEEIKDLQMIKRKSLEILTVSKSQKLYFLIYFIINLFF